MTTHHNPYSAPTAGEATLTELASILARGLLRLASEPETPNKDASFPKELPPPALSSSTKRGSLSPSVERP